MLVILVCCRQQNNNCQMLYINKQLSNELLCNIAKWVRKDLKPLISKSDLLLSETNHHPMHINTNPDENSLSTLTTASTTAHYDNDCGEANSPYSTAALHRGGNKIKSAYNFREHSASRTGCAERNWFYF